MVGVPAVGVLVVAIAAAPALRPRPAPPDPAVEATASAPAPQVVVRGRSLVPATSREVPPPDVAASGPGTFRPAVPASPSGSTEDVDVRVTVEIEDGLPFDPGATAGAVTTILQDRRGWSGTTFAHVATEADLRILIATPATTDQLCAPLETRGRVSCRNGGLVILNALRWAYATNDYVDAVPDYRRYLVNHEVGHALGQQHVECPAPGLPAPVMQQQTYGLDGCRRNPWPSVA